MGRYVYKPLVTYFEGDPEEKKFDFIRAYKDSLTSGELLVDLYNYDIYVANNGMEYPVPSTPELKKEIIDWIESDEGPLGSYKKNDLINSQVDKDSPSNIENKKERINNFLHKIELYQKECIKKIDENENMIKRINRETEIWYNDLSSYTYNSVYSNNSDGSEIVKTLYYVLTKYIDLYQRIENIERNVKYLNENIDLTNYLEKIQKLFKKLVDNKIAIDHKLDISDIKENNEYKTPNYNFSINIGGNLKDGINNINNFYNKLSNSKLMTDGNFIKRNVTEINDEETQIIGDNTFNKSSIKIEITNEGGK